MVEAMGLQRTFWFVKILAMICHFSWLSQSAGLLRQFTIISNRTLSFSLVGYFFVLFWTFFSSFFKFGMKICFSMCVYGSSVLC